MPPGRGNYVTRRTCLAQSARLEEPRAARAAAALAALRLDPSVAHRAAGAGADLDRLVRAGQELTDRHAPRPNARPALTPDLDLLLADRRCGRRAHQATLLQRPTTRPMICAS